jgi:hypothetical protein
MSYFVRVALSTAMLSAVLAIAPGGLAAMPAGLKSMTAESSVQLARRECIAWDRHGRCVRWGECGKHVC